MLLLRERLVRQKQGGYSNKKHVIASFLLNITYIYHCTYVSSSQNMMQYILMSSL